MAITGVSAEVMKTRSAQDVARENGHLDNLANDLGLKMGIVGKQGALGL